MNNSLYTLLNHCITKTGSRLLLQWIKQPLISLDEIGNHRLSVGFQCLLMTSEQRQNFIEAFVTDIEFQATTRVGIFVPEARSSEV